ncbi:hemicentin-1-like isoform X1 [Haliotis rufescens]|uniref:hemicentin-1-like isoform X1 n=1 Tax=Haliotis rufescens TaxID=6454 RepID=UPI00201F492C|nr:hemicentin-1-like isoform X1 [Haliotis rufescens]
MVLRGILPLLCVLILHTDLSLQQQVFQTEIQSTVVTGGATAYFQAVVLPSVSGVGTWNKDGVQLTSVAGKINIIVSGDFRQLFITNSQASDAGTYSYTLGGRTTTAQLSIAENLAIQSGLSDSTVNVGATVTLQTNLSHSGVSLGAWYKNGALIVLNSRIQASASGQSHSLSISDVQTTDAGTYEYRVHGLSTSATLVIRDISIVEGLPNLTAPMSQSVVFQVRLNAAGVTNGVWRKGQTQLATSGRYSTAVVGALQQLLISNIQSIDAGTYTFTVSGKSTSGDLVVTQALNIQLTLQNTSVSVGATIQLQAYLSQNNISTGTWSKNGVALTSAGRTQITVDGHFQRLTISNAELSDAARYSYSVSGQETSAFVNIISVPINGGFTQWSQWTNPSCGITCGTAGSLNRTRARTCTNPAPSNGGQDCSGDTIELLLKTCVFGACPVNGGFSLWTEWTDPSCNITCGTRTDVERRRTRSCNNPAPSNGGLNCTGPFLGVVPKTCAFPACVVPINGGFTQWSEWTDPSCGITCGSTGSLNRTRTRTCTNPVPSNGGQDCSGDTIQSLLKTCVFSACPDLCTPAIYRYGIGYRYHPTDCDKYVQCYRNPNGKVVAIYRRCPFGFFWNQVTFQCDDAWKVTCPVDKCRDNCTANFNLLGSCRAYWECDRRGVSVPRCCAMGFSYVERQGCRPNFFCRDVCPTACADRDVCDKRPDWNTNTTTYNMFTGSRGWAPTTCASGTFFDVTDCGCSAMNTSCAPSYTVSFTTGPSFTSALESWLKLSNVDVSNGFANFNGSSQLVGNISMPTASGRCPLIIRFRYRESAQGTGRRVLVSTRDCRRGNSLVIAVDNDTMMFELTSWYGLTVKLPVSMVGFTRIQWKTVTLLYGGYDMLAVVESDTLEYAAKVHASESTIMECGLTFGSDNFNTTTNFVGQLDQLTLYRCNPGNLY